MYRINHKAVILVLLLQLLVGFLWFSAAPASLVGADQGVLIMPKLDVLIFFCLAALAYVYFTAWLLVKIKLPSSFSMMVVVMGIWLCCVLPNFIFMSVFLELNGSASVYLLAYGAISCLLAAIVLPLWRSSRSIFKG